MKRHEDRTLSLRGKLAVSLLVCLCGVAGVSSASAQTTAGRIFGQAPAGQTVTAESANGLHRHITVKSSGHYNLTSLPAGTYTVALKKDGAVVDIRKNIPISANRGSEIDFACPQDTCAAP